MAITQAMKCSGLTGQLFIILITTNIMRSPERLIPFVFVNDLTVFKQAWSNIHHRCFSGNKIYRNKMVFAKLEKEKWAIMLTPVKAVKGQTQWEKSGTKQLINFFQELYLRYVNLLSFYSIG